MACPVHAVLDTQAVLDWLLFDDPAGRDIGRAIVSGEVRWFATTAMRDEYFEVLGRRSLAKWRPRASEHLQFWRTHCQLCETPPGAPVRCADPDDQIFIDLALDRRPAWLLSRDNAVLGLARQLLPMGVRVSTPVSWSEQRAAAEATARFET